MLTSTTSPAVGAAPQLVPTPSAPASSAPVPGVVLHRSVVKQVLSGDSVIVRGPPRGGPPPEKQINLTNVTAPRLARRPTDSAALDSKDEPFAWEAREFLRKKLVGQEITYSVQYTVPSSGREYVIIYLGKDATGENVAESLVAEGLADVRQGVKVGDEYYARLNDLQTAAKAAGKGKWTSDPDELASHVRDVKWTVDNPRNLVDNMRRQPVSAVIEHVRDGSTVRAFLLPTFHYVTVMMSGIKCPGYKIGDGGKVNETEPYTEEAKYFVETRLLQHDVQIILESASNQTLIGTIQHPKGNIAELLLTEGFAKCVDWSLTIVTEGSEKYRAAERIAKNKRLRLWKSYEPQNAVSGDAGKSAFTATVVEIVMADALMIKKADNEVQKIFLSSVRPPRLDDASSLVGKENLVNGKARRPLYDVPFMFEAREFLRKKLIGKKINVNVDYVQPASDKFPEKTCCTVSIGGQNVAEALVAKGLATVVRYAQGNENRSGQYDLLLAAEAKAEKSRKGLHSLKSPTDGSPAPTITQLKESPVVRVQELQGERSKQFFPFLQRARRSEGIVEFVASGSRFRIYVPKETCLLTFLLSGISCPRAPRTNVNPGESPDGEPFGQEALQFIKDMCLQHEIEFEVETMDKGGNFVGYAFCEGKNLSELLVEQGLAKVHSNAERGNWSSALHAAEDRARSAQLRIWTLPENQRQPEQTVVEEEMVDERSSASAFPPLGAAGMDLPPAPARTPDFKNVLVTEVLPELRFYVQFVDQGGKLEHMMSELRSELSVNTPVPGAYNPRRGELCAARFSADNQWYRAKVENVKSREHCDILYVDYGNRETVNANSLAVLPSSFHHYPSGAKEYRLAFVQLPKDPADAEAAVAYLGEQILAAGQKMLLNVEYKANGFDHVTLTRPSDQQDVGKLLVANGYATYENRRERRLQSVVTEYRDAQLAAKTNRLNLWQYGDFTGDEL